MSLSRNIAKTIVEKNIDIKQVVLVLQKYKLLSLLPAILQSVKDINVKQTKNSTIDIESPFMINDEALTSVKKIVGDTKALHTVTINKSILAGFKARWQGKLYDGSAERVVRGLLTNRTN